MNGTRKAHRARKRQALVQETKHIVRAATNNYIPIAISAVSGN
jgi:hypothetical protein